MFHRVKAGLFLATLFLLSACGQVVEIPTLASTARAVTPVRPSATAMPSLTIAPTIILPTATPAPTDTPVLATRAPTIEPGLNVNITSPGAGSQLLQGSQSIASGLVQLSAGETISVSLLSATGHLLAEAPATVSQVNSWEATLEIPDNMSGSALVRAGVFDRTGNLIASDDQPVGLVLNPEVTDRYLALFRPAEGETAVAGFNLFFDGHVQRPVNNIVSISLWNEECQVRVARQDFVLRGSGYWQGFLVVPRDVSGPVCAVAHFGEPGTDSWHEAQRTMSVLPADRAEATGVLIGNPPPGRTLVPGRSVLLYGTAYNAPDDQVQIAILLENGRILTEGVATVNYNGYWELELFIPEDASGPAHIDAAIGEPDDEGYAQNQNLVYIEPPA